MIGPVLTVDEFRRLPDRTLLLINEVPWQLRWGTVVGAVVNRLDGEAGSVLLTTSWLSGLIRDGDSAVFVLWAPS